VYPSRQRPGGGNPCGSFTKDGFFANRQFNLRQQFGGYRSYHVILKAVNHANRGIIELEFFKREVHVCQQVLQISLDSVEARQNHLILLLGHHAHVSISTGR
jgi:hypothetical protein